MKLLTHNFMACNIRGVSDGYPLKIEATEVTVKEADLDPGAHSRHLARALPRNICAPAAASLLRAPCDHAGVAASWLREWRHSMCLAGAPTIGRAILQTL